MICQASKRLIEKQGNHFSPIGCIRCELDEKHEGDHEGEHPGIAPRLSWPRGKQAEPAVVVRRAKSVDDV